MDIAKVSSITKLRQFTAESGFHQISRDFENIRSAIDAGDPEQTQKAYFKFQQELEKVPQSNPLKMLFEPTGPLAGDLQSLHTAVQSNDTAGAQAAMQRLLDAIERLIAAKK